MTHYKDTVLIGGKDFTFKPHFKWDKDGKSDINLSIPLTDILTMQAKHSFAAGIAEAFEIIREQGDTPRNEKLKKAIEDRLK